MSDHRRAKVRWSVFVAILAGGCGAKTGLLVPDVTLPEDVVDVVDVQDVRDVRDVPRCLPGSFDLISRGAEIMLVIDRSGSMNQSLAGGGGGGGGTSKWRTMRNALATVLPRVDDRVNIGALFYPEEAAESRMAACELANVPSVDLAPGLRATPNVLGYFDTTGPGGGTPTAAALLRSFTYYIRNPNPSRARFIVLATDGGPNCNASLDASSCMCTGGGGGGGMGGGCRSDATRCLDDARTIRSIEQLATNPITPMPTYVIGLAGDNEVTYAQTLTAMAIAGGRPNRTASGAPTFYDIRQPEELTAALNTIANNIARCTFIAPSRPRNDSLLSITVNGVTVTRDTTQINGWNWTDRAIGEITLFGNACPSGELAIIARETVACDDL
jgi:hypothetical protein